MRDSIALLLARMLDVSGPTNLFFLPALLRYRNDVRRQHALFRQ